MICLLAVRKLMIVAPLVGAWIEIGTQQQTQTTKPVAPLVGAWIEIVRGYSEHLQFSSLLL